MLAPDPGLQDQLKAQAGTALPVTIYCQVVVTLLPAYTQGITDVAIQTDLARLQTHVQAWTPDDDGSSDMPIGLCGQVSGTLPRKFVDYGNSFLAAENDLRRAAGALGTNTADVGARDLLSQTIGGLLDQLNAIAAETEALRQAVAGFLGDLQTDLGAVQGDLARISALTREGHAAIQQLTAVLKPGFVQPSVQSRCAVILTLDEQVSLQLTQIGTTAPDLVGLAFAQAALEGVTENAKAAQGAVDASLDGLGVLTGKYGSLKHALDGAGQAGIPGAIARLDIDVAARAWGQLRDFAADLIAS